MIPEAGRHAPARLPAMVAAVVGGVLTSLQSRMNGELALVTGQPVQAGMVSFLGGMALLVVMLLHPAVRRGLAAIVRSVRAGGLRWWQCLGGLAGGLFVANQTQVVPLLGIALFTVGSVAGQTGSGLLVDRLGIGPGGPKPIQRIRVIAAALALVGVIVAVSGSLHGLGGALLPMAATVVVGAFVAVQQGTNARVTMASGNVFSTTLVNFSFGTLLLLGVAIWQLATDRLHLVSMTGAPWWSFLGGLTGVLFIASASWAVRHLGVLVFGLVLLLGQLGSAVVLDLLNPAARGGVTTAVVAGVTITLVAAVLAGRQPRQPRRLR